MRSRCPLNPFLVVCLALSTPEAPGQQVRLNKYPAGDAIGTVIPSAYAWVWEGSGGCSNSEQVTTLRIGDLAGGVTTSEITVNETGCSPSDQHPDIAFLAPDTLLVVREGQDSDRSGIVGRVFDLSGVPLTGDFVVNENEGGWQLAAHPVALASGRFAVVFHEEPTGKVWTFVRIVMPDGSLPGPQVLVADATTSSSASFGAAATPSGGILVAWDESYPPNPPNESVFVRMMDQDLVKLGSKIAINDRMIGYGASYTRVAATSSGYLVAFAAEVVAGQDWDIYARYLDAGAYPVGPSFVVNTVRSGIQGEPSVAVDASDRAVIAWNDYTGAWSVRAQRLDAAGQPLGGEFLANGASTFRNEEPSVAMQPNGDFVPVWTMFSGTVDACARRYAFPRSLLLAFGPGPGNPPLLEVRSPDGSKGVPPFAAYGSPGYGANVGTGRIDGAATDDLLSGPGPSPVLGPHVRAFASDGSSIQKVSFYAYGTLRFGVHPAGGRIDADAFAEILTAPGGGAVFAPHVRAFNYDGTTLSTIAKVSYYAYSTLRWGARVTAGDIDGDGYEEIVTAPGPGAVLRPHVRGWDYDGSTIAAIAKVSFLAYTPGAYGCTVATADIESYSYSGAPTHGDGYAEIVTGRGPDPSGPGSVRLFDYDNRSIVGLGEVAAHTSMYGATVAGGDADAGDAEEIVTAPGPDPAALPHIIVWEWDPFPYSDPSALDKLGPDDFVLSPWWSYGGNVAVGTLQ